MKAEQQPSGYAVQHQVIGFNVGKPREWNRHLVKGKDGTREYGDPGEVYPVRNHHYRRPIELFRSGPGGAEIKYEDGRIRSAPDEIIVQSKIPGYRRVFTRRDATSTTDATLQKSELNNGRWRQLLPRNFR